MMFKSMVLHFGYDLKLIAVRSIFRHYGPPYCQPFIPCPGCLSNQIQWSSVGQDTWHCGSHAHHAPSYSFVPFEHSQICQRSRWYCPKSNKDPVNGVSNHEKLLLSIVASCKHLMACLESPLLRGRKENNWQKTVCMGRSGRRPVTCCIGGRKVRVEY